MSEWLCEDCGKAVIGKIRRGRCDKCYRTHLVELRESGQNVSATPRTYRPRRKVDRQPALTLAERAFRRATPGWGGCILYTGRTDGDGYARIKVGRTERKVIRPLYMQLVGAVPPGMMLDHICHSSDEMCPGGKSCVHRRCINPRHLEPVTPAENNMRGRSLSAENFLKKSCKHGHDFTPENTRLLKKQRIDGTPYRECRTCSRIWKRNFTLRRKSIR